MPANSRKFKVRTGCITCKIRKIKCDEGKPDCTRCTSTGRKCDGYTKLNVKNPNRLQSSVSNPSSRIPPGKVILYNNITALPLTTTSQDHRWLEYFRCHAGPALAGLAGKDFWTCILPQLGVSEPAIRHALIAVGSSYARFVNDTTCRAKYDYSIKNYSLAVADLRRSMLQPSKDTIVPLICWLLFFCVECLYGNQTLMLSHLSTGLKILSSTRSAETDIATTQSPSRTLEQIFRRLDAQSMLYGREVVSPSGDPTLAYYLELPSTFVDIFEAKRYLDVINLMSLNFIRRANDGTLIEKYPDCSITLLQRRLQEQFIAWRNAFDNLDRKRKSVNADYKDSATRLLIEWYASFIYISNCLDPEESSYDAYHAEFAALVSLARDLYPSRDVSATSEHDCPFAISSANTQPVQPINFSIEASLIPSLYLAAFKCRDPVIRREAVSLLGKNTGRESLWDAKINHNLARRIIEIEEQNMLLYQGAADAFMEPKPSMRMQTSNGVELTDLPLERFRVLNGQANRNFEEDPRSPIQITFYTKPWGVHEQMYEWQEELHF